MRRIQVDIPGDDLHELDRLASIQGVSRAELIRRAVSQYLVSPKLGDSANQAFGIWKERREDGLAVEARLRSEWHCRAAA